MEDYPKTILEFETRFASEQACREYLLPRVLGVLALAGGVPLPGL